MQIDIYCSILVLLFQNFDRLSLLSCVEDSFIMPFYVLSLAYFFDVLIFFCFRSYTTGYYGHIKQVFCQQLKYFNIENSGKTTHESIDYQ